MVSETGAIRLWSPVVETDTYQHYEGDINIMTNVTLQNNEMSTDTAIFMEGILVSQGTLTIIGNSFFPSPHSYEMIGLQLHQGTHKVDGDLRGFVSLEANSILTGRGTLIISPSPKMLKFTLVW